jgi:hypothetical protein
MRRIARRKDAEAAEVPNVRRAPIGCDYELVRPAAHGQFGDRLAGLRIDERRRLLGFIEDDERGRACRQRQRTQRKQNECKADFLHGVSLVT